MFGNWRRRDDAFGVEKYNVYWLMLQQKINCVMQAMNEVSFESLASSKLRVLVNGQKIPLAWYIDQDWKSRATGRAIWYVLIYYDIVFRLAILNICQLSWVEH